MCRSTISLVLLKKTIIKTVKDSSKEVERLIESLMEYPHRNIVRVLGFNRHSNEEYSYTMERLLPLSSEEEEYFYIYFQIDDLGEGDDIPRRFSTQEGEQKFRESHLNFDEKMLEFRQAMSGMSMNDFCYNDLHPGNVMKDTEGNYKFIDLEGFF
jgi:thiamine kinase-like enzyme